MASSRRSRENHWRILDRALDEATMCSQSREGPAVSALDVKISTVSAELSLVSRGTRRPLTLAPMHLWPTSVWIEYAKSTGVALAARAMTLPLGVKT